MVRVAYYSKPGQPFLMRMIKRGFSCTRDELDREVQIACGLGAKLISHTLYSSSIAAQAAIDANKPEWKEETDE